MSKDKMWALLVPLSKNWEPQQTPKRLFDDEVWDAVVKEVADNGLNTIVIDLLDGICYGSHPEIALEGAWTREHLRAEIKRLKEMGIQAIPKLNFSATHDGWMKQYERYLSTPEYYKVCRDLIMEAAELFDHPKYIHLGMDEENARLAACSQLAVYRKKELLMHDMQFYFDCVRATGATPWIWADPRFEYPEYFKEQIKAGDLVLSPWMYSAIYPEHYTPITSRKAFIDYYSNEPYASMNLKYVEEDPHVLRFMKHALPCVEDGYDVIPCVSTNNKCRYNALDMLKYFKENADPDRVLGYITSAWYPLIPEKKESVLKDIQVLGRAKREVYEGFVPGKGESASDIELIDFADDKSAY